MRFSPGRIRTILQKERTVHKSFEQLFLATLLLLPIPGVAAQAPIQLSMSLPRARGASSTLTAGNYTIALHLSVQDAVAFVEDISSEAMVLKDPDGCIDMSHFSTIGPFETCSGGPNETFVAFRSERSDQPAVVDSCTPAARSRLIDHAFSSLRIASLNKPYLRAGNLSGSGGSTDGILEIRPVGAFTGGTASSANSGDCYGLAADDDLPGLVLMANIGPLRVFNTSFNLVGSRIRNFAGMLNSVTIELLDQHDRSAIVAFLRVPDGLLEPLTLVDRSVTRRRGVDFLTRRDSGPIQSFKFSSPPANKTEEIAAILDTFPDVNVTVRAVIVKGQAPSFIDDRDGNGIFGAKDLELAGFQLLSSQAILEIHAIQNDVLSEFVPLECPAAILAGDLDGNGLTGYTCNTGNARSIRRPPS
jgi:hypothetical protein